jgi:hypothetical protein
MVAHGKRVGVNFGVDLKVHKNENFSGSDFEFCTISLLVMLKYSLGRLQIRPRDENASKNLNLKYFVAHVQIDGTQK